MDTRMATKPALCRVTSHATCFTRVVINFKTSEEVEAMISPCHRWRTGLSPTGLPPAQPSPLAQTHTFSCMLRTRACPSQTCQTSWSKGGFLNFSPHPASSAPSPISCWQFPSKAKTWRSPRTLLSAHPCQLHLEAPLAAH